MSTVLDYEKNAQKFSHLRFLSRNIHVIIYVNANPLCSVKDAQFATGLSNRGFYLILQKLLDQDLILTSISDLDRRKKLLSLTEKGKGVIESLPQELF